MKPMLAYTIEDVNKLKFPQLVSVKLDGIRAIVKDGVVYSRSLKPIRSKLVQEKFGKTEYEGLDGELIYGSPTAEDVFNLSTQAVMSTNLPEGFEPDKLRFFVFDTQAVQPYDAIDRQNYLMVKCKDFLDIVVVGQEKVQNVEQLLELEARVTAMGYEGVMCKDPYGFYKNGRSTAKGGEIGKLKRFVDEEATVIGFVEKMHNTNEATTNELGDTERSSAKDGLVGAGTLGSLVVQSEKWGVFNIGSGFNDEQRKEIWKFQKSYMGSLVKFKYFAVGVVEKPRFPVFLGFRDKDDIS